MPMLYERKPFYDILSNTLLVSSGDIFAPSANNMPTICVWNQKACS